MTKDKLYQMCKNTLKVSFFSLKAQSCLNCTQVYMIQKNNFPVVPWLIRNKYHVSSQTKPLPGPASSRQGGSSRQELSHEGVLAELGGAQREAGVGGRRGGDVRVGREDGLVLGPVHGGGRQQAGVDAHGHLVHHPATASMAQAVAGGLQQRAGGAGRGQEVRDGRRRGVGEDGGLPAQVGAPREVAGAALGQRECRAGHGGCQERLLLLLPPRGEVPVPLLQPRGEVLDLARQTETGRA